MTIVVRGTVTSLSRSKQLNKLIDVIKVIEANKDKSVFRELMLIKVNAKENSRASIIEIVDISGQMSWMCQ